MVIFRARQGHLSITKFNANFGDILNHEILYKGVKLVDERQTAI